MRKKEAIRGANPYLPLWEHIPDGEPRVFTFGGETRVYLYGSHDTMKTEYCGMDYVVWSAPAEDLTDWRCHGVCYEARGKGPLYAPDVVRKGDVFYLYAAEERGSRILVARSDTPWGPFTDPIPTELGFDPGVLVDDDGRVYAYWGFCSSFCAELNEDMATLRPGTLHAHPIWHCRANLDWIEVEKEHVDPVDAFFEASSPRKINGKYVYIYSKRVGVPRLELGIEDDCNGFLSYKWSDRPLEGFRGGGDISFNGGEILLDEQGRGRMTYRWGNNHGSLAEINGRWYVFYHRQTDRDEFSRQAMMEPIEVAEDENGNLLLGKILRQDGKPVGSVPVEMTSQGPHLNGLDARKWISAGYACHLQGGRNQAYIARVDEKRDDVSAPVRGITSGTVAGFRYLQFGSASPRSVTLSLKAERPLKICLRIDSCGGPAAAEGEAAPGAETVILPLKTEITGKHAVYFEFTGEKENDPSPLAEFDRFTFD